VAQGASATDQGVEVRATGAAFSGTGTHVELIIDASGFEEGREHGVERVTIRESALIESDLPLVAASAGGVIRVPAGEPFLIRFGPADPLQPPTIVLSALDLLLESGEPVRVQGDWQLPLAYPQDIAARLARQELAPDGEATDAGVTMVVEGAVRSTTETVVTVRVEAPAGVSLLGRPRLRVGDQRFDGVVAGSSEDGSLLELAFPPTAFGQSAVVELGPFMQQQPDSGGSITFDLGLVAQRGGVSGAFLDSAIVTERDILSDSAAAELVGILISRAGSQKLLRLELEGAAFPGGTRGTVLRSEDGAEFGVSRAATGFRKDATGTIVGNGWTTLSFRLEDELADLSGVWTLTTATPSEIVRGTWQVQLTPLQ
jgi:hypothetical protein